MEARVGTVAPYSTAKAAKNIVLEKFILSAVASPKTKGASEKTVRKYRGIKAFQK